MHPDLRLQNPEAPIDTDRGKNYCVIFHFSGGMAGRGARVTLPSNGWMITNRLSFVMQSDLFSDKAPSGQV